MRRTDFLCERIIYQKQESQEASPRTIVVWREESPYRMAFDVTGESQERIDLLLQTLRRHRDEIRALGLEIRSFAPDRITSLA